MTDHLVFDRLKDTLANCQKFPADKITPEATLQGLGGDSMDAIEATILLEEEFNIDLPDDLIAPETTIQSVVTTIEGILTHG